MERKERKPSALNIFVFNEFGVVGESADHCPTSVRRLLQEKGSSSIKHRMEEREGKPLHTQERSVFMCFDMYIHKKGELVWI